MCGIGGVIVSKSTDSAFIERAHSAAKGIVETQQHRGPDANRCTPLASDSGWLTHNRLSIIDLSDNGLQPRVSECGRYTITFNGELYNFKALRASLKQRGCQFASQSDTEVILQSFILDKEACLTQFRGMFAFFIWDNEEQIGFAARDAFGIKPFYYAADQHQGLCIFTSELSALCVALAELGAVKPTLDVASTHSFFRTGSVPEPHTLVNEIKLLGAGEYAWVNAGAVTTRRYNSIEPFPASQSMTREHAIAEVRTALEDSIKAHFVSDVPVGLFLSGGIDSSVLVALASQQRAGSAEPLRTFSIAFGEDEFNEGHLAAQTAAHFGTQHTEWTLTEPEARQLFTEYLDHIDQPTIDGFNTFCVSKLAHESGIKVVLSGLGGDELFGGYPSFGAVPKLQRIALLLTPLWPVSWLSKSVLYRWLAPKTRRIFDALTTPFSRHAAYQAFRGIYSEQETDDIIDALGLPTHKARTPQSSNGSMSYFELTHYLRNQLLRDSDVMSMAWSLELRVPFIDKPFVDSVLNIPEALRFETGKRLLTDAVPELPEWVLNQPKRGFSFPFDQWINEGWQAQNPPDIPHLPAHIATSPWYRRWALLVFTHVRNRIMGAQ